MKKLIYIANIRLPTEKAHGIQIMKMCEALASTGNDVQLVLPKRLNSIKDDPFEYYRVQRNFKILYLPCIDFVGPLGRPGFIIQSLSFAEVVFWWGLFHFLKNKKTIFYSRDELPLFYLTNIGIPSVWEAHMGHINFFIRALIRRRVKIVAITNSLKNFYIENNARSEDIFVAPDGVDLEQFNISFSTQDARKHVGLPLDETIILYTGHLYEWKGADTLARAAPFVSPKIKVTFVGGTDRHIDDFKERYGGFENVFILGKKPHHEMPFYLKAADILVIPNSAKEDISRLYTSPMKLFEYMASGVPIIASDLPSLREIVDESLVYFFTAEDPSSLSQVISHALNNYEEAKKKGERALILAENFSWQKRVKNILEFI